MTNSNMASKENLIDFKSRIKEMSETIIQSLHIADILDDMVSFCALTVDDRAFIDAQPTLTRKTRMFLEVILSRGEVTCEVFVDLLRENGHYKNLVEKFYQGATGYDECDMALATNEPVEETLVPEYKVRLQKNYSRIASVKFDLIFDFLLAKDVISFIDYEDIKSESTLSDQNRKLVDILMLKSEHAYQQFVDTLRLGDKCLSVAEGIETTSVTKEEQTSLARHFSDKSEEQVTKLTKQIGDISAENEKLKAEMEELKDPIPPSIKEHFKEYIKDWEIEEERYIVTRATKYVQKLVESVNCIVVTGSSGNGKSALIHHVALQMHREQKYEIIPFVVELADIIRYRNPQKNQVFVIDDICGKVTVNVQTVDWWYTHLQHLEKILSKGGVKILASCRLHIYNDPQFHRLKHLFTNECNLLSSEFSVLHEERLLMARKYFAKSMVSYIKDLIDMYDFFPLLCKLYNMRPTVDARMFFSKPIDGIREDLQVIQQLNKNQYCALVMVILFNNRFKIDWLKPSSRPADVHEAISDISNECLLDLRTQSARKEFKQHLDALLKTYIKKTDSRYRMIHDKIYDIGAVVCGQHLSECFIKHADSTFLGDRFRFESCKDEHENDFSSDEDDVDDENTAKIISDENVILISEDEEEMYFDRLIEDLKKGITYSAFHNKQLHNSLYRSKFITHCKTKQKIIEKLLRQIEEDGQALSARTYKEDDFRSIRLPLIESVFEGYEDIVEMLLDFKCEINLCDKYGRSALHVAATLGYLQAARLLLENNADTSLTNWMGQSAFYASCEGGHTEIVNLLLKEDVEVNQSDIASRTALFVSCQAGHAGIVKILLRFTNEHFVCDKAGRTPFFVACKEGHSEVVKILLKTDLEVDQCAINGLSPLHIACQMGHVKVVKLLLANRKFSLHHCENNMRSPLHLACESGHSDVVKLLLKNKANISQCDRNGQSPLYTACEGGHAAVVKILLDSNADIHQCDVLGRSPLYAACGWEHAEVIDLLLKSKNLTDVSHCDQRGFTALHVACFSGHVASVMLLLQYNFPVSRGDKSGQTPLILACKCGHQDVVSVLLNNGADVLKCDNNGRSPLYFASKEGYLDIVKMLLERKADPAAADNDGTNPLHMALNRKHLEVVKILSEADSSLARELSFIDKRQNNANI